MFQEQPGPGNVMTVIGTQVELNCSVMDGQRIIWYFYRPGFSSPVTTDQLGVLEELRNEGIIVEFSSNILFSLLTMNATERNNKTEVECASVNINDAIIRCASRRVVLTFFGMS